MSMASSTPETRAAVEAHVAARPEAAAELAALQRQADNIRTLFAPVAAEPVPARLNAIIASPWCRAGSVGRPWAVPP